MRAFSPLLAPRSDSTALWATHCLASLGLMTLRCLASSALSAFHRSAPSAFSFPPLGIFDLFGYPLPELFKLQKFPLGLFGPPGLSPLGLIGPLGPLGFPLPGLFCSGFPLGRHDFAGIWKPLNPQPTSQPAHSSRVRSTRIAFSEGTTCDSNLLALQSIFFL